MWKELARQLSLNIPNEQLERISPLLDSLYRQVRVSLDRDLSTVEPVGAFRPKKD